MRVALFIPCYVDQLRPAVGIATLEILEALDLEVVYPEAQTCCGQPFLTAGKTDTARKLAGRYVDVFSNVDGIDAIVTPSGSCAATMRRHLPDLVPDRRAGEIAERTKELCEFLVELDAPTRLAGSFAQRVGLHTSCHALRELRLGTPSETREPPRADPARLLLESLDGLELIDLVRRDECCGFGGVFSVTEEAVSCRMGRDRLADHRRGGAEVIASTDVSCLLHLDGLARRGTSQPRMLHVAELIAESLSLAASDGPGGAGSAGGTDGPR